MRGGLNWHLYYAVFMEVPEEIPFWLPLLEAQRILVICSVRIILMLGERLKLQRVIIIGILPLVGGNIITTDSNCFQSNGITIN